MDGVKPFLGNLCGWKHCIHIFLMCVNRNHTSELFNIAIKFEFTYME